VLFILEILSVAGTILYIYLAARKKPVAWIFGISASVMAAYLFFSKGLYGSSLLNAVYALQGIIGYVNWKKFISDKQPAYGIKWYFHLLWILACIVFSVILCGVFTVFFTGEALYADMLLASFSIFATTLEIRKDTSCWWYWIVCNLGYSALYIWQSVSNSESLYLYAMLMFGLAIFSYVGLRAWEKEEVAQA
jgi:nicotinamide mononucleotide transporter PnuC